MKNLTIFLYEWKHFWRNPFKSIALLLFILASIYSLHNGANLYESQMAEIEKISQNAQEQKQKIVEYYDNGEKSLKDRPWVDLTKPFWAIWNVPTYHFKVPSPLMVYSIGQAEQYGFYKQISVWASPYDADMAEEISNPERLQIGTLDFAFVGLFLLPLLFLILVYNLKSSEIQDGFLSLIYVQTTSKNAWLLSRMVFYFIITLICLFALLLYGSVLTHVWESSVMAFFQVFVFSLLYLVFWSVLYFFILHQGKSILGNTVSMVGLWLFFTFIIPGAVHQYVSLAKPVNLMIDLIDMQRDGREEILAQPDSVIDKQLFDLFPSIKESKLAHDSTVRGILRNFSVSGLANAMVKKVTMPIQVENQTKNRIIQKSYWFNPLSFFQNQFNLIAQTHYLDYEAYRMDIQNLVDKRIHIMVTDTWNGTKVDKVTYVKYENLLKQP